MAAIKLIFAFAKGEFEKALKEEYKPMAKAGTEAMREVAAQIKTEGRADIASAGFSRRWQNTLRADSFPRKGKVSLGAAVQVKHRIPYAGVFEEGATIMGNPLLWLPLPSTPKRIGRRSITPALFAKQVGPLVFGRSSSGTPLLFAKQASRSRRVGGGLSLSSLKRGASGSGPVRSVPVFFGVSSVKITKRFHILQIAKRIAARIPELYFKNLETD